MEVNKKIIFLVFLVFLLLFVISWIFIFNHSEKVFPIKDLNSIAEKYMFSAERKLGVYRPIYLNFDHQDELYSAYDEFYNYLLAERSLDPNYEYEEELISEKEKSWIIAYRYDLDGDGFDEILGAIMNPDEDCTNGYGLYVLKPEKIYKLSKKDVSKINGSGYLHNITLLGFFNSIYIMPDMDDGVHKLKFEAYGDRYKRDLANKIRLRIRDNMLYSDMIEWYSDW